jgi:hypothetical protein
MVETITLLAAVILIPLVPAFLLYKFLPSKAAVKGPLKGLQLNLQGAFAGYFALVLLSFGIIELNRSDTAAFPRYEEYDLFGSIVLKDADSPELDRRLVRLILHPRVEQVEGPIGASRFEWATRLPLRREADNELRWPYEKIVIEYPGYFTDQVDLRSGAIQEEEKKISFKEIELEPRAVNPSRGLGGPAVTEVELDDAP